MFSYRLLFVKRLVRNKYLYIIYNYCYLYAQHTRRLVRNSNAANTKLPTVRSKRVDSFACAAKFLCTECLIILYCDEGAPLQLFYILFQFTMKKIYKLIKNVVS